VKKRRGKVYVVKTLAFVPFRKGSKGIPNKNIRPLNGVPLFKIVVEELLKVSEELLQKIVIATDYSEEEIMSQLPSNDRLEFWNRLNLPSTEDTASTESSIFEYLMYNNSSNYFDNMLLVQITNPLLDYKDIESAIKKYDGNGTIFSVIEFNRYIWTESKLLLGSDDFERKRRQDMENTYLENGSFYLFNIDQFCINSDRMNKPINYQIVSLRSTFEIDSEEDWAIIEDLMKNK
jgi:N-acylneuraminate cytidylyltransferase